jgi:putative ABC transport system ATP-binding protein
MSAPLIDITDVRKVYKTGEVEVHALRGVSLAIEAGEFVAIMGSSGSGKSTLMNVLGCLDRPTSGTYRLGGREVSRLGRNELAEVRNEVLGFVFQSFNLLTRTRVAIARAIVGAPKVILADEPTGNLDSRTSIEVIALFQELGRVGITILLVTHEPDIAEFASRVVVVKDGLVVSDARQEPKQARPEEAA